jgi:L-lysine exporter family protein LysE/ArgO
VCALSDAVLIAAGVGGLGTLVQAAPVVLTVARIAGAAFLLGSAVVAARRAWRPAAGLVAAGPGAGGSEAAGAGASGSGASGADAGGAVPDPSADLPVAPATRVWPVVGTALALTWLNPHVYLDTVVLLGSVAGTHGGDRWWFGSGAVLGSVLWFTGLGYGARLLRPVFARPAAWRVLDAGIAVVMVVIAASLLLGL